MERIGVLFVCLGNICRSPLAQGVFAQLVSEEGLGDRFDIDSAGTSDYHIGEPPDPRTTREARRRGVTLEHAARQVDHEDFERFDYVLAMDAVNLGKLERIARQLRGAAELHLLRAFDPEAGDDLEVPDPYFGGPDGFADVHEMIERACRGLLEHIRTRHAL
ncbi:MAG TPA: low molecular weight protein-tyrosine-phosphatase [Longimicrobiales bacterium]